MSSLKPHGDVFSSTAVAHLAPIISSYRIRKPPRLFLVANLLDQFDAEEASQVRRPSDKTAADELQLGTSKEVSQVPRPSDKTAADEF